eukprot:1359448-Alexandrium_andersonii.AAC.1
MQWGEVWAAHRAPFEEALRDGHTAGALEQWNTTAVAYLAVNGTVTHSGKTSCRGGRPCIRRQRLAARMPARECQAAPSCCQRQWVALRRKARELERTAAAGPSDAQRRQL